MDISQLRTLVHVAELGSLSKAAARLRIAQPALSRQVRLLEDELGVPLFARHGRGMVITEQGQAALRHAKRILAEVEALKAGVTGAGASLTGHVAIGLPPTIADMISVPLAAAFRAAHPGVMVQLVSAYTGYLLDGLHRGEIDLAILYDPRATRSLRSRPLMRESLFLIGPGGEGREDGAPMSGKPVPFEALAAEQLLLPSDRHGLRIILQHFATEAGITLDVAIETDSYTALKDLVRHGYGLTILPLASIHADIEAGRLTARPIVDPAPTRRLVLSYPPDRTPSRAASFAGDAVLAIMTDHVERGIWVGEMLRG
ncbi:LysR substrate-binding domain-containing protein [Methylobacterium sp. E-045]|uniref:LysR family transcriptional regulator n=1 Tax=Methylobacterium sp. E-045 TaxID=2836575 RepID=UPI001FB9D6A4|nr:LysR substrate-binding domain-containing protein [Methylobacterium sp. E-045]MCJ2131523.1 LysR substrate-binding domain-containing protein [Methylobacterium sp. E-045]